jgi:hypothetical protein
VKKTLIRLGSIAMIGLALAACGGHHDGDKDHQDDQPSTTTTVTDTHSETPKNEEHHTPRHEPTEHKDTVVTEHGTPKVDTADAVKPKDETTMGSGAVKHHVKPGGVQGNK